VQGSIWSRVTTAPVAGPPPALALLSTKKMKSVCFAWFGWFLSGLPRVRTKDITELDDKWRFSA
jgi:hypothetical protein